MGAQEEKSILELEAELTAKQARFAREYIIDRNGTRAAKAAGYSEKSAEVQASENIRKPKIQQFISALEADYLNQLGITKSRIAQSLAEIAFTSEQVIETLNEETGDFEPTSITVAAKDRDRIAALKELKAMGGFDAPKQSETKVEFKEQPFFGD